jgi:hypothetical protein
MIASPGERAHGAFGLAGVEADHVDDRVELSRFHLALETLKIVAISLNRFHSAGKPILALPAIKERDLGISLEQMFDNARGNEPGAAEDEDVHGDPSFPDV